MKTLRCGFTLVEALVVASVVVLLAAIVLPAVRRAADEDARRACSNNLSQIAKACITYGEPNGDYFPAHSQYFKGDKDDFKPMPSLASLYPSYVDSASVFGCPATKDEPFISIRCDRSHYDQSHLWTCFGTDVPGQPATNPVWYSGSELSGRMKCSYFYDEFTNFRDIGPGQAMCCDADGQTWKSADGAKPKYPLNWTREPQAPNHAGGQNVMYFDGHVKWQETAYCSRDPHDNIFCPQAGWGADTDAYLWDGVNARQPQQ